MTNVLEMLAHGCAGCGRAFKSSERVCSIYRAQDITSFEQQVELGIIGAGVRNHWVHLYCSDPTLKDHSLKPDIHHCIECRTSLDKKDMVMPVFQVTDPRAVNPLDPTDVGLALAERVYFVHGSCRNKALDKDKDNPLTRG